MTTTTMVDAALRGRRNRHRRRSGLPAFTLATCAEFSYNMKSARVAESLDNERWDSAFHWPPGNHWFYNGFIRYLQATTICSTRNPSFSIGFIRFSSQPCSCVMLSHRTSGRAQCTQGGKLVFYWFYKGSLAELPVLVRFFSASRVGAVFPAQPFWLESFILPTF